MAYLIFQPLFIDGAQLFQQHYGIFIHIVAAGIQFNMRRQLRLVIFEVIAAQITVGLCLFPTSFWMISTGRMPPCSEPMTGLKSA